jgi:hypothetical protein
MPHFATLVLWAAGLGFLGFGLWLLLDPVGALGPLGIEAAAPAARTELRAFYGGLELGLGLWLLAASRSERLRRGALWLVLAVNAGIATARLFGLVVDGEWIPFFTAALAWELGFAALAGLALRLIPPRPGR